MRAPVAVAVAVVLALAAGAAAEPVPLGEVVVTADRVAQPAADVAADVTVLERAAIDRTAALTTDDLLRQVAGFNLFRRSSSLVSNPTTQGVSLRGLGASGASRTLVLLDGVPLNDVFGGWIPWSRVPVAALERVEIVRGPAATVWGNYALGGVINLITAKPTRREAEVVAEGGTRATVRTDGRAADRIGPVGVQLFASWLDTGGYPVIRDDRRGRIDVDADSDRLVLDARANWAITPDASAHLHANGYQESRGNGTPLTDNASDAGDVDAGADWHTPAGDWSAVAFGRRQDFEARFSSQALDRNSELPASDQFDVPASAAGGALTWSRAVGGPHRLGAGVDGLWIDGESDENARFLNGAFTRRRTGGATQQLGGAWAQAALRPLAPLSVTLTGRVDVWRSIDGFRRESDLTNGSTLVDRRLPDRQAIVGTPGLALRWDAGGGTALRGAVYRGFRAPTINELVRPFRVRNDVTEANADLDPEQLLAGEVGVDHAADRWDAQLTAYWARIEDPITNVTVGAGPGDVPPCGFVLAGGRCRQRQNLGAARARGIEASLTVRPRPRWSVTLGSLVNDSRVTEAGAEPALEGKQLPQVPRYQVTTEVAWTHDRARAAVAVRWVGEQFEDDRNTLPLGDYAVVDLSLGWRITGRLEAFFRIENAFDRTYEVSRTADGVVGIGMPLLAHGGVRVRF